MINLILIGIGTGNPDHLTGQAIKALNSADLVLIPQKGAGKADLADLRRDICGIFLTNPATQLVEFVLPVRDVEIPGYVDRVHLWHDAIAGVYRGLIDKHLPQGGTVALLVWGDPSLYDSTLRISDRLAVSGLKIAVSVIPGLTSLQMLTALHVIPLNSLAAPFTVTTGRHLRDNGFPAGTDTVVVMLDGENSFRTLPPDGLHIYWGAYLGMADQTGLSGPLQTTGPQIIDLRARLRAEHGWVMDTYLLRRV